MVDEILKGLHSAFGTALQTVYVGSIDKTLSFREANVKENKTLSKIVISNRNSQSVIYASTLSMIKNLCLDDDFDPYSITEFDRLKIIIHLFSNNFFSKKLTIRCPRKGCGHTFPLIMKYGSFLKMLDSMDSDDIIFENKTEFGSIKVWANFPTTKKYLDFLEYVDKDNIKNNSKESKTDKTYESMDSSFKEIDPNSKSAVRSSEDDVIEKIRKRRDILNGKIKKSIENKDTIFGNVDVKRIGSESAILDMADMYIKRIYISEIKGTDDRFDIDFTDFSYEDTERVLGELPLNLFIMEDGTNIVSYLSNKIFEKMNKCVPNIMCEKCGYEISKKLTLQNFFIFG